MQEQQENNLIDGFTQFPIAATEILIKYIQSNDLNNESLSRLLNNSATAFLLKISTDLSTQNISYSYYPYFNNFVSSCINELKKQGKKEIADNFMQNCVYKVQRQENWLAACSLATIPNLLKEFPELETFLTHPTNIDQLVMLKSYYSFELQNIAKHASQNLLTSFNQREQDLINNFITMNIREAKNKFIKYAQSIDLSEKHLWNLLSQIMEASLSKSSNFIQNSSTLGDVVLAFITFLKQKDQMELGRPFLQNCIDKIIKQNNWLAACSFARAYYYSNLLQEASNLEPIIKDFLSYPKDLDQLIMLDQYKLYDIAVEAIRHFKFNVDDLNKLTQHCLKGLRTDYLEFLFKKYGTELKKNKEIVNLIKNHPNPNVIKIAMQYQLLSPKSSSKKRHDIIESINIKKGKSIEEKYKKETHDPFYGNQLSQAEFENYMNILAQFVSAKIIQGTFSLQEALSTLSKGRQWIAIEANTPGAKSFGHPRTNNATTPGNDPRYRPFIEKFAKYQRIEIWQNKAEPSMKTTEEDILYLQKVEEGDKSFIKIHSHHFKPKIFDPEEFTEELNTLIKNGTPITRETHLDLFKKITPSYTDDQLTSPNLHPLLMKNNRIDYQIIEKIDEKPIVLTTISQKKGFCHMPLWPLIFSEEDFNQNHLSELVEELFPLIENLQKDKNLDSKNIELADAIMNSLNSLIGRWNYTVTMPEENGMHPGMDQEIVQTALTSIEYLKHLIKNLTKYSHQYDEFVGKANEFITYMEGLGVHNSSQIDRIFQHLDTLIKEVTLFAKTLPEPSDSNYEIEITQLLKKIGIIHYWLAHAMPFDRGSAAIMEALIKGITLGFAGLDISFVKLIDCHALTCSSALEFSNQYPDLIKKMGSISIKDIKVSTNESIFDFFSHLFSKEEKKPSTININKQIK